MFKIVFNKTDILGEIDAEDTSVGEAIWTTYPDYDSDVFLHWKTSIISLDKRGTMSDIYNDVIYMLKDLREGNKKFQMSFLCSGFTAYWNFEVIDHIIHLKPEFFVVSIKEQDRCFDTEEMRKLDLDITVDFDVFINEWHRLLKSIKQDLLQVGYTPNLENFEYLEKL
jgi:hypothetical protein